MAAPASVQATVAEFSGGSGAEKMFAEAKDVDEAEDATVGAERAARKPHIRECARQEERQKRKLRGRKPKAPGTTAGRKDKKLNTTDPQSILADAGCTSEENFAAFGADDPDSYVAVRNMKKNPTRRRTASALRAPPGSRAVPCLKPHRNRFARRRGQREP